MIRGCENVITLSDLTAAVSTIRLARSDPQHSPPFAVVAHFNIGDRPASTAEAVGDLFGLLLRPWACSLSDGFLQDLRREATHSPVVNPHQLAHQSSTTDR
jgi:hypothetical protein